VEEKKNLSYKWVFALPDSIEVKYRRLHDNMAAMGLFPERFLECHHTAESASRTMIERYGSDNAFR
jgi:hypothetical protein